MERLPSSYFCSMISSHLASTEQKSYKDVIISQMAANNSVKQQIPLAAQANTMHAELREWQSLM